VGINFIGRRWDEPTLLRLAHGFEQGTRVRHAPRFLPSLGVEDFLPRDTGAAASGTGAAASTTRARAGAATTTGTATERRVAGRL
jgi:hypothetical protein